MLLNPELFIEDEPKVAKAIVLSILDRLGHASSVSKRTGINRLVQRLDGASYEDMLSIITPDNLRNIRLRSIIPKKEVTCKSDNKSNSILGNGLKTHNPASSILTCFFVPRGGVLPLLLPLMLLDLVGVGVAGRVDWMANSSSVSARMGGMSWSHSKGLYSALVNGFQ